MWQGVDVSDLFITSYLACLTRNQFSSMPWLYQFFISFIFDTPIAVLVVADWLAFQNLIKVVDLLFYI